MERAPATWPERHVTRRPARRQGGSLGYANAEPFPHDVCRHREHVRIFRGQVDITGTTGVGLFELQRADERLP